MARRAALLLVAVALAAAGCNAGVPPNGEVVSVSTPPTVPSQFPERAFREGDGPGPGYLPAQVARGFMNSMARPKPWEIVNRWVVPDGAAQRQVQSWAKDAAVKVYDLPPDYGQPVQVVEGGQLISRVDVRVRLVGELDGEGQWTPDAHEETFELKIRQVSGEWRVANPMEVPLVDSVNFRAIFAPVELFWVAPDGRHLSPLPKFIPRPAAGTDSVAALDERASAALQALLDGPPEPHDRVLDTAIPAGTRLREFTYDNGVATVDLSARFTGPGLAGRLRVGQIVWLVSRLSPTTAVRVTVEGETVERLGPEGFDATGRWRRTDPPFKGMWPQRRGNPDLVLFTRKSEIYRIPPDVGSTPVLIPFSAPSPRSAPTWEPGGSSSRIAFLAGSGDERTLWVGGLDGEARNTGVKGRLSAPTWAPDGSRLLVLRRTRGGTLLDAYDLERQRARTLSMAPLPGGLQPTQLRVSPDGAYVLAVGAGSQAKLGDPGQLFLGLLEPSGVTTWLRRPIAPGLGQVSGPVWVDPLTVAFIARTGTKGDQGRLWVMKADGWEPTPVVTFEEGEATEFGGELTVDPDGSRFVFTVHSGDLGTSLWMADRDGGGLRPLTSGDVDAFDSDPSFASR